MIRLGFVSAILPDLDLEGVVDLAAAQGYSCVELMCWPIGKAERRYAGVTHLDVATLDARRAEEIKRHLAARKIAISGLGYYPNLLEAGPQAAISREHFLKVIDAAARLGVGVANTFIGRDPARNLEENLRAFEKVWPPIVEHAGRAGVKIGIENCPMYFTIDEWPGGKNLAISPVVWRRMFDVIPAAHFGLNFDPSHFVWQHMDYLRPLHEFKDRIFHVHLKDAKILAARLAEVGILATPLEYHAPKLPGLGDVDWGAFFSTLTDIGYDGAACVEVEDRAFEDTLESRTAALAVSRNYLRQFLPLG